MYPFIQVHPSVSGERIVWQDMRSGKADIYMYDAVSRTESVVANGKSNKLNLR